MPLKPPRDTRVLDRRGHISPTWHRFFVGMRGGTAYGAGGGGGLGTGEEGASGAAPVADHAATHQAGGRDPLGVLDLPASLPLGPSAAVARLAAVDDQGFTQLEERDATNIALRLARDAVMVMKVDEPGGVVRGQPVYIAGGAGAHALIRLAQADSATTMPAVSLVLDTGAVNTFVRVMTGGRLRDVNTAAWPEGSRLFVSPATAGALVTTPPPAPAHQQRVGWVVRQHAVQGEILVMPTAAVDPAWLDGGGGGTPAAHAATHEPGGTDPIMALDAAVLTTGTIDAARLPAITAGPGGAPTQVQFNDAGVLAGDAGLTYDKTTGDLQFNNTPAALQFAGGGEYLRWDGIEFLLSNTLRPDWTAARLGTPTHPWSAAHIRDRLEVGSPPARSSYGDIGISNDRGIYARNNADTADVKLLNLNGSDVVEVGTLLVQPNGDVVAGNQLTAPGGLGTTPLNASQLLFGTVPDARLSANVPLKAAPNTFTASPQTITDSSGEGSTLRLKDLTSPVNRQMAYLKMQGATIKLQIMDDVGAPVSTLQFYNGGLYVIPTGTDVPRVFLGLASASPVLIGTADTVELKRVDNTARVSLLAKDLGDTPLNASNLTTGTVPVARLPAIPVTPGGANQQVQFNDGGALGGDAGLTYDKATDVVKVATAVALGAVPAASGSIRLPNAAAVVGRNGANNGDIPLVGLDALNAVIYGDSTVVRHQFSGGPLSILGGQISFPPTPVLSSDPNTLDEYRDQITWLPVIISYGGSSGQVYGSQTGRAMKIGSLVFASCIVSLATKGTHSGNLAIGGLPYPVLGTSFPTCAMNWFGLPTTFVAMVGVGIDGQSLIDLRGARVASNSSNTPLVDTDLANGSGFTFSFTYMTNG